MLDALFPQSSLWGLSPEDQAAFRNQALLGLGLRMLANSSQPTGIGLGQAGLGMLGDLQVMMTSALQARLLKQKMKLSEMQVKESERKAKAMEGIQRSIREQGPPSPQDLMAESLILSGLAPEQGLQMLYPSMGKPSDLYSNVQIDALTGQAWGVNKKTQRFEPIPSVGGFNKLYTVQGASPEGIPTTEIVVPRLLMGGNVQPRITIGTKPPLPSAEEAKQQAQRILGMEQLDELEKLRGKQEQQLELMLNQSRQDEHIKDARKNKRMKQIEAVFSSYQQWIEDSWQTEPAPYIQLIAVLARAED